MPNLDRRGLCALRGLHTLSFINMSQIVDQRLFEIVKLVGVSNFAGNEQRRRLSLRSFSRYSPAPISRFQSRKIVSFSSSPCGRLVVLAAACSSETGEPNPDTAENRPFLASVLLSKSEDCNTAAAGVSISYCDFNNELIDFDVQWLPWFQDTKLKPTCLTLNPECDFCLIGCENGSFFIISTKTLCPGFELRTDKDSSHKDWSTKRAHKVYPIDHSPEIKGKYFLNTVVIKIFPTSV